MSTTAAVAAKIVIVADDTAFVRDRFKSALEGAGHRAVTVSNGNELIARVKAELDKIDLIVVDLRLPQAQGVDLVRRLRKLDPSRPPIVVFSGTIANAEKSASWQRSTSRATSMSTRRSSIFCRHLHPTSSQATSTGAPDRASCWDSHRLPLR